MRYTGMWGSAEATIGATGILIELAGGVALLLWSMRMVRTGMLRAYGGDLRRALGHARANRLVGLGAGLGVTLLLQSSTATALMVASFVGRGLLGVAAGLAVMLGADIGSSLVVQVLSLKVQFLWPVLLLCGVLGFLLFRATRWRDLGRVAIGLGLLLLALRLILEASQPMLESPVLAQLIGAVGDEPILALLIGAGLTWLVHSSVAVVLLVAAMTGSGVLPLQVALVLVLGANVGGAMPALILTWTEVPAARRVPLGNLFMRGLMALLFLPLLGYAPPWMTILPGSPVAAFHVGFNLALAVLFIGLTGAVAALAARLLPDRPVSYHPGQPRYLDRSVLDTPSVALAAAARETLRMGDEVAEMLRRAYAVIRDDDRRLRREVERADDVVDSLHEAIKLYTAALSRDGLGEAEMRRCQEIVAFATNLEHIGDIIDKNLMELAAKKIRNRLSFSDDGLRDIEALHGRVEENLQLAFAVFISGDVKAARQLIAEKVEFRELEQAAADAHLARLRSGRSETVETSSLHLDILRDLKRIHSHIASVAYPILEAAGELRPSRLAWDPASGPGGVAADLDRPGDPAAKSN